MEAAPHIFLVNQISGHGHLDTYAGLYSRCLLELGYRVTLIAERESSIAGFRTVLHADNAQNFTFFARAELSPYRSSSGRALPARISRVWREEGARGIFSRLPRRLHLSSRRYDARMNLVPVILEVEAAARRIGAVPALVFFLYLDFFSDDPRGCRWLENRLGVPWAGLLFHPRGCGQNEATTLERYFQCKNARGAAFLNPAPLERYQSQLAGLDFAVVPDITDSTVLQEPPDLVCRLRECANGRTVVLLFGTLTPHKGVLRLIEVIRRADPSKFFFAIVGEPFWAAYGAAANTIREFALNLPENCLVHFAYLEDERELNAIIAASNIIYAVYDNFADSSNSLTKAAAFNKPILVNRGGMMALRVTQYRIGKVVSADDVGAVLIALESLRESAPSAFDFSAYRRDHSFDALKEKLASAVPSWLSRGRDGVDRPSIHLATAGYAASGDL